MNAFEGYLRAECGRADGTVRLYLRNIRLMNDWLAALGTSLEKCPASEVRSFVRYMSTRGRKATTIANYVDTVATYWRFLERPQADLDGVERPRIRFSMPDIPGRAEVVRLIEAATDLRDRAILEMMYATGVRSAELRGLRIEDLQTDYLKVRGKGSKDRLVPVGQVALGALSAYLFTRPEAKPPDWMFIRDNGQPFDYGHLAVVITRYAKASKQRCKIHPHTLRHCFATHMLIDGKCNPRDIQGMMGHESLETTARYMHLQIGDIKREHMLRHPRERQARGEPLKIPCGAAA